MRGFVGFLTLAIAAIVGHFAFPVVVVADEMMAPAIRSGDWSVMFALRSEPVPGRLAGFDLKGRRFVRRIVAGPGATVRFKRGALHVDGAPVPTKKLPGPEVRYTISRADGQGVDLRKAVAFEERVGGRTYVTWARRKPRKGRKAIKVPPGHVFMACDNRSHCKDSRHFGPVPIEAVWATR